MSALARGQITITDLNDGAPGPRGPEGPSGADAHFRSLTDNGCRATFGIESEGVNKGHPYCHVNVDVTLYDVKGEEKTVIPVSSANVKLIDENGNTLKSGNISNNNYGIFLKGDLTAEKFATIAAAIISITYLKGGEEIEEIIPFALSENDAVEEIPDSGEEEIPEEGGADDNIEVYTLTVPVTFANGVSFDINQKTKELNAWALGEDGDFSHFGMSPKNIALHIGNAGIDLEKGKITLSAQNTIINGDLNLKGVIIESTKEVEGDSISFDPIIIDMDKTKSITVYNPLNSLVVLPMYDAFSRNMTDGKTFNTKAFQQAGAHLTIYNSPVEGFEGWSALDETKWGSVWGEAIGLLERSTLVCADPRMLFWNSSYGFMQPMHEWHGGSYQRHDYAGGRFSVRGAIGRFILLPPGQMLHLISSLETFENDMGIEQTALVWHVVNASDFEPAPFTLTATYYNSSSHYHKFPNGTPNMSMQWTGSADNWEDMFFAARQYKRACGVRLGAVPDNPISGMSIGIKLAGPLGNEGTCMPYRTQPYFPNGVQMVSPSDV